MSDVDETSKALADFYDRTDTSAELNGAVWESEVAPDPMVTTSLRLPKSLLDQIRDVAAAERMKPTALIRRLVEIGILTRAETARVPTNESDGSARTGPPGPNPREAALAAMVSRAAVEDASRAAQELVEQVRQEVLKMHRTALADAALLAFPRRSNDSEAHDLVVRATEAAATILTEAEDESARIRADAERQVEVLIKRREAIAEQLRDVREMLGALTGGVSSLEPRDPERLRVG